MSAPEVSHGRGGAGNVFPDDTKYVDGEITRQGDIGSQQAGAYSTGRGGGGNIGDVGKDPLARTDKEVVPEAATRPAENEPFHVGRGGNANVHPAAAGEPAPAKTTAAGDTTAPPAAAPGVSTADKLKNKLLGVFKK
jgi:hypothetical protein